MRMLGAGAALAVVFGPLWAAATTVTAAITPKASTGKVRIVLARTNAKGKVIASKALFAGVSRGKATKRWQIPRAYTTGNYTVVATYLPSRKGAPGVTAVAPVTIG